MEIDYYCFLYYADDDIDWGKGNPERWGKEYNSFMQNRGAEDVRHALKIGKALFYNVDNGNIYYDIKCTAQAVGLDGKVVLPRSYLHHFLPMVDAIQRIGGASLITAEDDQKVTRWPETVQPAYRKIKLTTLNNSFDEIREEMEKKNNLFVKTVSKKMNGVFNSIDKLDEEEIDTYIAFDGEDEFMEICEKGIYRLSNMFEADMPIDGKLRAAMSKFNHGRFLGGSKIPKKIKISVPNGEMEYLLGDTPIMYTDAVDICKTAFDKRRRCEYRGFVINGKLSNMDLYPSREGERNLVPSNVTEKAYEVIDAVEKTDFPRTFVIDLMKQKHEGREVLDITEFNNAAYAGREMQNSFFINEK